MTRAFDISFMAKICIVLRYSTRQTCDKNGPVSDKDEFTYLSEASAPNHVLKVEIVLAHRSCHIGQG